MEPTFPTKAIILNRSDWREADRLVSVYSQEFGRLSLLARGARKLSSKLAAHLEPISLSQLLVIKGKGFDYVGSAIMIESFAGIKGDLNKLYFAGQALNFFKRLVGEGEKDEDLFNYLEKWLISLDRAGAYNREEKEDNSLNKEDGRFRLALFYWRILSFLGYGLSLDSCVSCHRKIVEGTASKINFSQGGLLCPLCQFKIAQVHNQSSYPITDNCIKWLRYLDREVEPNLKTIKMSAKLLKEWEFLHEKRMSWLDV
jgi:DNA repair protein RecO (recombination protein O)